MRVDDVAGNDAAWWFEIACSGGARKVPAPTQNIPDNLSVRQGEESAAAEGVAADSRMPAPASLCTGRLRPTLAPSFRTELARGGTRAASTQVRGSSEDPASVPAGGAGEAPQRAATAPAVGGTASAEHGSLGILTPFGMVGVEVRAAGGGTASTRATVREASDPAEKGAPAAPRSRTVGYIDLAEITAMNLSVLPGFLSGMSRAALDQLFKQYFPGGQPEILEDWDVKAFIQAAIAKRQIQSQAGIPYDFPLAPGIVVNRRA